MKDINFKLSKDLRSRLRTALKEGFKSGSAVKDLGCSIESLKVWLEQQFYPHSVTGEDMTWNNYGHQGWHIDHVLPLVSFDLKDRKQLKRACHWFNLQPLWAQENWSKGAKLL